MWKKCMKDYLIRHNSLSWHRLHLIVFGYKSYEIVAQHNVCLHIITFITEKDSEGFNILTKDVLQISDRAETGLGTVF